MINRTHRNIKWLLSFRLQRDGAADDNDRHANLEVVSSTNVQTLSVRFFGRNYFRGPNDVTYRRTEGRDEKAPTEKYCY